MESLATDGPVIDLARGVTLSSLREAYGLEPPVYKMAARVLDDLLQPAVTALMGYHVEVLDQEPTTLAELLGEHGNHAVEYLALQLQTTAGPLTNRRPTSVPMLRQVRTAQIHPPSLFFLSSKVHFSPLLLLNFDLDFNATGLTRVPLARPGAGPSRLPPAGRGHGQ